MAMTGLHTVTPIAGLSPGPLSSPRDLRSADAPICHVSRQSHTIVDTAHAALTGTIGAAVHPAGRLDAMADDAASAMDTLRSELVDGALEAVEGVAAVPAHNVEALVVIIPADLTLGHLIPRAALVRIGRSTRNRRHTFVLRIGRNGSASLSIGWAVERVELAAHWQEKDARRFRISAAVLRGRYVRSLCMNWPLTAVVER